ncbi:MAG TPA: hypothetical protein VLS93_02635 [Anaeromyxobacteraceae bacterium]|nr:hypothetical protein [Anaeromyxobacteraceae bacterium]
MSKERSTNRTFWAEILAKASDEELAKIVETLEARRAAEGSAADGDLLILARWTLQHRNAGARAGTGG